MAKAAQKETKQTKQPNVISYKVHAQVLNDLTQCQTVIEELRKAVKDRNDSLDAIKSTQRKQREKTNNQAKEINEQKDLLKKQKTIIEALQKELNELKSANESIAAAQEIISEQDKVIEGRILNLFYRSDVHISYDAIAKSLNLEVNYIKQVIEQDIQKSINKDN